MHFVERTAGTERNGLADNPGGSCPTGGKTAPRPGSRSRGLTAAAALAAAMVLPAIAYAQVPDEFLGKWSTSPKRCEQINGEVDMLEVLKSGFEFYEVGCEVKDPSRIQGGVRFAAQCWKGGIPDSMGTAIIRHPAPDKVEVVLQGFSWDGGVPEAFRRCKAD